MKFILLFFSFSLMAQESDYTKVYSSLKEITIFEDMAESSKFKNCVKKEGVDLDKEVDDEKLNSISSCFLNDISDEGLLKIEKDLGLKQLNFVKDKRAPIIRKYLEDRLMKGLYGDQALNESPEMRRQRSQKIVNQKTFLMLYKNFIVNSIHMAQAQYCLKSQEKGSGESETRKIVQALEKLQGKNSLKDIWRKCVNEIVQTSCTDLKGKATKLDWNSEDYKKSTCALKLRLREYRLTLQGIDQNIKVFDEAGRSQYAFVLPGLQDYTGKNAGEEDIQTLSNITSYDAYKAFEDQNPNYFNDETAEFNQFCAKQNLDQKKCAEAVNKRDMENFNKLKLSVMSEFNNKKNKLSNLDKNQLLKSVEVQLLTDKEKAILAGLTDEADIKKQLDIMLENYKVGLIHELNEKLKAKMASNQTLSGSSAVDEIRFGLENKKAAMMGAVQFQNTMAQYNKVKEKGTNKPLGNFSIPIEQERSDIEQYLEDSDAQKWVKNESPEYKGEDGINTIGDEFFNQLFGAN